MATLAAPTSMKTVRASSTTIKINWVAVAGTTGYEVWRSTSSTGTFSLIKATTLQYYTNTGLTTGRTYYYKVRAYRLVGSGAGYPYNVRAYGLVGKRRYTVRSQQW